MNKKSKSLTHNRFIALAITLIFQFSAFSVQTFAQAELQNKPKLVVGIVVDQMRWDYLTRYNERYGDGGFKRMMNEGYNCNRLNINYIPAVTAVGHAAIYTGSVPAFTGIVGNSMRFDGKWDTPVRDWSVQAVGTKSTEGQASPHRLIPTTMTDELRLATNFRSKVISVSIKDRGSVIPGGHCANAAYWMDSKSMDVITSTYYMKDMPAWVKDFNKKKLGQHYLDITTKDKKNKKQFWDLLYAQETYVQSTPNLNEDYYDQRTGSILRYSPYGNTFTADLALAALEGEQLGHNPNNVPDFLCVSFSCSDMVAHKVGPNAIWVEDLYLRLDQDLKRIFDALDEKVGKGEWVAFLTADHAGSHNVQFRKEHNITAGTWPYYRIMKELNDSIRNKFRITGDAIESLECQNVYFNDSVVGKQKNNIVAYTQRLISRMDNVAYVYRPKQIPEYIPEPVRSMAINGHHPKRSGDIAVILEGGITEDYDEGKTKHNGPEGYNGTPIGTNHAVWSPYDTHIPFIIMGKNVRHAWDNNSHTINDIAATVCGLLDIQQPSACLGSVIDVREK